MSYEKLQVVEKTIDLIISVHFPQIRRVEKVEDRRNTVIYSETTRKKKRNEREKTGKGRTKTPELQYKLFIYLTVFSPNWVEVGWR